jgi:hypothetical protein
MFDCDLGLGIVQSKLSGIEASRLNGLKNLIPLKLLEHVPMFRA